MSRIEHIGDIYQAIAVLVEARQNCANVKPVNHEWYEKHTDKAKELVKEYFPHGSGFDNGTHLDFDSSTPDKLVFVTSYHHMDEGGGYDGWTEHTVIVTPSLPHRFKLKVTGRNRNDIKDLIVEAFS